VLFPPRLRGLFSPLSFSPLALYPSFFFSLLPFSRVSAFKNFFFQGAGFVRNRVSAITFAA